MSLYINIFIICILAYVGMCVFALFAAEKMIFPAPYPSYTQDEYGFFKIPTPHTEIPDISARFYRAIDNKTPFTLLYAHGNGEDLGSIAPRLQALAERGFNVLAYDYPGYGTTGGTASEANTYLAADAAYRYLTQTQNIPPAKIILYGRSVGGGPTYYLAQKHGDIAGVITESTFTSTYRVITRVKLLPMDAFDNIARIGSVNAPILLIHGTRDYIVPFSHGEKLLSKAPAGTQYAWIKKGGHNNLVEDFSDAYYKAIETFITNLTNNAP